MRKVEKMDFKSRQMRKLKQGQKGITLIALIITVVVMLILAVVTINLTLGQNGIFTTAQKAAQNYTQAQNQEMAGISGFTEAIDKTINNLEKGIYYATDNAGNAIPVPVGFSPITTPDQGTKDTGFVIKNDTDGNEFVWVPVEGMSYSYNRYAILEKQPEFELDVDTESMKIRYEPGGNFYYIERMPEDEKVSVSIYGGYYIGRYETGKENGRLVVQKNKQVWSDITRDSALTQSKSLYNKESNNVASKLCSSYAWDTALKFMESTGSTYPTNSVGGYYEQSDAITTGYDTTHPCNIYDMGGNVWEWTTEFCTITDNPCVSRGGVYYYSASYTPAAYRSSTYDTFEGNVTGFRIALFI